MKSLWNAVRRFRTWIFNVAAAIVLVLPDILNALVGYNWGAILPPSYLPYVTIVILVVNVLMRPRPAVLPSDPEARRDE